MENTFMKDKEAQLRSTIKEGEQRAQNALTDVEKKMQQGQEYVKKVIEGVDKQLEKNPWPVVGGVAIGCILLGFILGMSKKS